MSPRARGYVLATLATGTFALVVVLTTWRTKPPTPTLSSRSLDAGRRTLPFLDAGACVGLAKQYAQVIDALGTCTVDTDCLVEDRGGFYATLDGCYRIVGRTAPKGAADQLAEAWLAGGCVHQLPACEKRPTATCRQGHCAERPPAPVPDDWHRERVPGVLTMFLPPDMHRVEAQGEDSFVLAYQGTDRRLGIELGWYAPDPSPDAHFESAPFDKVLSPTELVVSGRTTTLFRYEVKGAKTSWAAEARVPHVPDPWFVMFAGASDSSLFFGLSCETKPACDAAPTILGSLEVLSEVIGR